MGKNDTQGEDGEREGQGKQQGRRGVGRPPGVRERDSVGKIAAVMKALELIEAGRVGSKSEAASLCGIDAADLTPASLQKLFAIAPEFRRSEAGSLLSIVHEGNGKPETARQSLERGVVAAVAVLGKYAGRIGELDKTEVAAMKQARDWLALCRECGLWSDDRGANLPGELQNGARDEELDLAGVDRWLRAHNRRDGMGQTAVEVLTERRILNSPSSQVVGDDELA